MTVNTSSVLATDNLSLGYKTPGEENRLFENLNLSLHAGELVCFMGPNGVGKSTLIKTLAGLRPPLSGKMIFSPEFNGRREGLVSVVLTERIMPSNMNVYELISIGRYPYLDWTIHLRAADHDIIERSLAQVHLQQLSKRKIDELSDGQMQMVMIARALAQDTPILLLDEPTAHLDLNNRVEIMNLLRKLSRTSGKAILMATHELDLALQTADRVWLATGAKEIKTGVPEDLVLDGTFDEVFQFKGYDLKTGKVDQEAHRGISVHLIGHGPEYLWTKNALERSGFEIADPGSMEIVVEHKEELVWRISGHKTFTTLQDLLEDLKKN